MKLQTTRRMTLHLMFVSFSSEFSLLLLPSTLPVIRCHCLHLHLSALVALHLASSSSSSFSLESKSPTSASSSISGSTHSKYDAVPSAAVENHVHDAALHLGSSSTYHRHEKPQQSIAPFFMTTMLRIVLGLVAFALCVMGGAWAVEAAKNRFDPVSIILTVNTRMCVCVLRNYDLTIMQL
jgi:hypothetical protein